MNILDKDVIERTKDTIWKQITTITEKCFDTYAMW